MKRLMFIIFALFSSSAIAQVGISLYPLNNTIGLKTSPSKPLSFELRMSFNVSHSTSDVLYMVQPEACFLYRVSNRNRINFYTGLYGGYGFNNASGDYASAGLICGIGFYPITSDKNILLTGEMNPGTKLYSGYQDIRMTGLIGLTYFFSKASKK